MGILKSLASIVINAFKVIAWIILFIAAFGVLFPILSIIILIVGLASLDVENAIVAILTLARSFARIIFVSDFSKASINEALKKTSEEIERI